MFRELKLDFERNGVAMQDGLGGYAAVTVKVGSVSMNALVSGGTMEGQRDR
jgi:hypothetical protein